MTVDSNYLTNVGEALQTLGREHLNSWSYRSCMYEVSRQPVEQLILSIGQS